MERVTMPATPARGDRIPDFTAPTADGATLRSRDLYLRRNLALAFTHGPDCAACRELLRGLARQVGAARAQVGQIVAVVPASPEAAMALALELDLGFPVVADADLAVHRRYGLVGPDSDARAALFVADRYGIVFDASVADAAHRVMAPAEVPGWLEFVACRCS
ncbi:MAG TPA: redoxin domain-containing protein [Thermomicrobiaceae bacterium]|nr:redoxin domain-containing protein [Thermomicrobiaceae bacterium]